MQMQELQMQCWLQKKKNTQLKNEKMIISLRVLIIILTLMPMTIIGVAVQLPDLEIGENPDKVFEFYRSIYPISKNEDECELDPLSEYDQKLQQCVNKKLIWSEDVLDSVIDVFRLYRLNGAKSLMLIIFVTVSAVVTGILIFLFTTKEHRLSLVATTYLHLAVFALSISLPWIPDSLHHADEMQRKLNSANKLNFKVNWFGRPVDRFGFLPWLLLNSISFIASTVLIWLCAFQII
jgi:hypothetical protein